MSYARKGKSSDVYVYLSVDGEYRCDGCKIWPSKELRKGKAGINYLWCCARPAQMIQHLREHQAQGDTVPEHTFERLWSEVVKGF